VRNAAVDFSWLEGYAGRETVMAIEIIVDGYNFIGKQRGLRGDIEQARERLIADLARYHRAKDIAVTVVFDGTRAGWGGEHGEARAGVQVVFSAHGETADDVIARMAAELGNRAVVVSSDRAVARATLAAGGVALSISEFERRLHEALAPPGADKDADEDDPAPRGDKRGNPRRRSKQERKKQARLHRL
jgi:predicted RNA-binding protein with PIN domain